MAITPTLQIVTSSTEKMRDQNSFTRNFVFDRPVITIANYSSQNINNSLAGVGNGAPPMTEVVAGSDVLALRCDTGDIHVVRISIPLDIDLARDVDVRALWSNTAAATAAQTSVITWKYQLLKNGITAPAAAADLMDTNAGAQISFGANIPGYTGWSTINGGKISSTTYSPGEDWINLQGTVTLVTLSNMDLWAVQMRYYRKSI